MSLRCKVNVAVLVYDFKNIELWNQGHYYAEIQFYVQTVNARYIIAPDEYEKIKWSKNQMTNRSKNWVRTNIDPTSRNGIKQKKAVYKTQGWNIRYTEEECPLNEIAYFTTQIDLPQVENSEEFLDLRIPLIMEVSLYFQK